MSVVAAPEIVAPAFHWVPDGFESPAAAEAADLAAGAGLVLDPEQRLMLETVMAERDGRPVFESCIVEARQNGKTWALMAAVIHDLVVAEDKLIVWSAHEFATAQRTFKHFRELIEGADFLSSRVVRVATANGEEGFEFRGGQELRFRARTKAGGRGLDGDKVILDEAFALQESHMGALLPIMTTKPNSQVRYASSAGLPKSEILRSLRDRGRPGGDASLSYVEWCATRPCDSPDCDHSRSAKGCTADDAGSWLAANPGVPRRRDDWDEFRRNERRALPVAEYCRERMGWWDDPDLGEKPFDEALWRELVDLTSEPAAGALPVFALDANPDRTRFAVAGCAARVDGVGHLDLHAEFRGVSGVVERVAELAERHGAEVVVLADGPALSLIPQLEDAGVKVRKYSGTDFAAACGLFKDGLTEKGFRHIDREPVADALTMARKRERDGVWTLTRKGGDIAPLVACVLAFHAWAVDNNDYDVAESIY